MLPAEAEAFSVVDAASGTVVWVGGVSEPIRDESAGAMLRQGDFTEFSSPGVYKLTTARGEVSYPFEIAEERYQEL